MGDKLFLLIVILGITIQKLLEFKNKLGLFELLSEDLNQGKKHSRIKEIKNLDFITTTKSYIDPVSLLTSDKFEKLIESIKSSKKYKYIILNSAPVLGIADSILTSKI